MIGSELGRRLLFWASDLRRGAPIARELRDVRSAYRNVAAGRKQSEERLTALLAHACETTAFYRREVGRVTDPTSFPVLAKSIVQEHCDQFLSASFDRRQLLTVSTSGSYGTPSRFFWTPGTYARRRAELLYFGGLLGYRVGMPFAQVTVHPRGSFAIRAVNSFVLDPSLIDGAWLEAQRRLIVRERLRFLIGYPSSLGPLASHCLRQAGERGAPRLLAVISSSEALLPEVRAALTAAFRCPVIDRYATNEFGVIAQECRPGGALHVNIAGHRVEILKRSSDRPAAPGEVGRVVVTDLFSQAMPLIRYDTGDLGAWRSRPCSCGSPLPALEPVAGRLVEEVRDPDGRLVNPLAIGRCWRDLDGVLQWQFIQRGRDSYLLRVVAQPGSDVDGELRSRFVALLGSSARLEIERVAEIAPLPSGKRPSIVNRAPFRAG